MSEWRVLGGEGGRTVRRPRLMVPTNLAAVIVRDIVDGISAC